MTPIRTLAHQIAAGIAGNIPHTVKVTEDARACRATGRPVFAVFVRIGDQSRGRRVASILGDAAQDHAAQHCTCDAAAGAAARREAINNAQTEEDYLAAGESHWSEYVEPCAYCVRIAEEDAAESFAAADVAAAFEPAVILEPIIRTDKRTGAPRVRWLVRNAWTGDYLRSICAWGGPVREYATPERAEAAGLVAFGPRT